MSTDMKTLRFALADLAAEGPRPPALPPVEKLKAALDELEVLRAHRDEVVRNQRDESLGYLPLHSTMEGEALAAMTAQRDELLAAALAVQTAFGGAVRTANWAAVKAPSERERALANLDAAIANARGGK